MRQFSGVRTRTRFPAGGWCGTARALCPARYACEEHRGDLVAFLREHYGTLGFHPWKRPPYPHSLESADTDHAWNVATRRQRWSGF